MDLALHYGEGPILLKDIAQRQEISEKYLWQLINPLKTTGLVNSLRGAHGGYVLGKAPEAISLKEILQVLEGSLMPGRLRGQPVPLRTVALLHLPGHLGRGVEEHAADAGEYDAGGDGRQDRRGRRIVKRDNNLRNFLMCMCLYTGRGGLFM